MHAWNYRMRDFNDLDAGHPTFLVPSIVSLIKLFFFLFLFTYLKMLPRFNSTLPFKTNKLYLQQKYAENNIEN